jgi:hypothetical protein
MKLRRTMIMAVIALAATNANAASQCMPCPPGKWSAEGAGTSCTQDCGTGYYCASGTRTKCGNYSTTTTATASSIAECQCNVGYYGYSGTCAICPPGKFQVYSGSGDCYTCVDGTYCRNTESNWCVIRKKCPAGVYPYDPFVNRCKVNKAMTLDEAKLCFDGLSYDFDGTYANSIKENGKWKLVDIALQDALHKSVEKTGNLEAGTLYIVGYHGSGIYDAYAFIPDRQATYKIWHKEKNVGFSIEFVTGFAGATDFNIANTNGPHVPGFAYGNATQIPQPSTLIYALENP